MDKRYLIYLEIMGARLVTNPKSMVKRVIFYILSTAVLFIIVSIIFYMGRFISNFENNICYSEVISDISILVKETIDSQNIKKSDKLNKMLSEIPYRGYETDCEEIKSVIKKYREVERK